MAEILTLAQSEAENNQNKLGHILLYTDCPGIYGASQWNHSLIMKLVDLGYDVSCAQCQASHHLIEQRNQRGIQHFWLNDDNLYLPSTPARAFSNTSEFQTIFALAKPDLIVFSDGCPVSNIVAKKVAIQMEIPYIILIHAVTHSWVKKFVAYLHYLPDIYQQARGIFTVSQENLDLLHQKFKLPENLGRVIYNGRPAQYFNPPNLEVRDRLRQQFSIPHDAVVCFTAARMDISKGYQYQIKAIEQLKQRKIWSQLYFIWAGTGNLSIQLQTVAAELGISDRIKFVGERADIPDLLDAADIFILPSQFEGMPLAIMEAMAKGKPAIASAVSGIPEQLGNTGKLLSDPKLDPEATIRELAIAIETLAADAELRYSIGQAGKIRAEKMFREERMLEEYVVIIKRALIIN
ncbi:MAG TPA: glycosyltransferase family 4 protein [Leptolyngbyaceae cyanobacterium]